MSETLRLLESLVAFPSLPRSSNLTLVAFVEQYLKDRGFEIHRLTDPTGEKAGLVARIGPEGKGIVLSGHMDVVPVEGQDWTRAPFELSEEAGRLFGRGTTDMKGYVAAMLALADRASEADLKEPLRLVLSYDEEIGCVGIQEMRERMAPLLGAPRACFVGEPTQMEVAIGHKGKTALRAVCHGEAGHSALAPNFTNALHVASDFMIGIRALQDDIEARGARDPDYTIPYTTLHIGCLSGGTALNIVPDRAELLFEFRHLAADRPETIRERIDEVARAIPGRIDIDVTNAYPGLDVPPDADVVRVAQQFARTNTTTKVAFGTEAGIFDALGLPTVVCGPGSMAGQGHKPDEFIERSELAACDAMMARILDDICH